MSQVLRKLFAGVFLAALVITGFRPAVAATPTEIKRMVVEQARKTAVPASLALAVAKVESNLRPDHEGLDGARGLMQILPEMAESMGVAPSSLWNPETNLQLGLKLLSGVLERTEGRWEDAVAAYASHRRAPKSAAAQRYVTSVLNWERSFAEQLALQDDVAPRRRDVLADNRAADRPDDDASRRQPGHDDWRQDDRQRPEESRDDADPEVTVYRGGGGDEVEITVYHEPEWRAPPPPPPPRWAPRFEPRPRPDWRPHYRVRRGPAWSRDFRGVGQRMARRISRTFRRN